MIPATRKACALAVFTTLFCILSIPRHLAAQSCGEVGAPACDGACPSGQACIPGGDGCQCQVTGNPCGFFGPDDGPACLGFCVPGFEICIVGQDLECLCVPAFTPTPTPTETPTRSPTNTPTPTNTQTPTGTPTATPESTSTPTSTMAVTQAPTPIACVGDCNRDSQVTVDEIVRAVNIALGNSFVSTCLAVDGNGDNQVTVDEIVRAVNSALNGCD